MQHMPDKEFDNLFRDKFKDAEIEPSANLWANIEQQLSPKPKRVIPIYWMAAASIAVAITAMLLTQKTEKIQLRANEQTASVVQPTIDTTIPNANVEAPVVEATKYTPAVTKTKRNDVIESAAENNLKNIQLAMQPNNETDRLPIKQQDVKPLDVLPIKEIAVENPIVIAQVETPKNTENNMISEIESSTEHKGIRNVGDLVNYVVDKVDKRDKKLLRFNTDDDDNSSLIGINIGFLKFNKKNK